MRDIDNNLSTVMGDPNLSTSYVNSDQNSMINHLAGPSINDSYSQLRDKLWEVIDKEIGMSQCDIYR